MLARSRLDAIIVATPVDDALFDGFGLEVLGEGLADQRGDFGVGGEAEGDKLFNGEFVDVGAIFSGEECGETETLLKADDAVLDNEGAVTEANSHYHEDDCHDDPPEMSVLVTGPVMHRDVDGEDEVEQKHGQHEEVIERIEAGVIFEVLRGGHWSPLRTGLCRRASAYHLVG